MLRPFHPPAPVARAPGRRVALVCLVAAALAIQPAWTQPASPAQLQAIQKYIHQTWRTLTRSNERIAAAAVDPKFKPQPNGRWPVYISRTEDLNAVRQRLLDEMPLADFGKIEIRQLPEDIRRLEYQGLLYLPRPYVVPGGRFNEMYGWDSYFIQTGLLEDGDVEMAKNMAENFLYEIRNYGKILNANRSYYLTRSQPPFLTQMVLGVWKRTHDRKWLEDALPAIESYYRFWTTEPHLTPETGLSRYFDLGEGPAPEVLSAERDERGHTHYDLVREYFRRHKIADYDLGQYYNRASGKLTRLFYKGDRSMRESGFDPSNRFGPFNIDIIHYNPVCLNSLLYLMEQQIAEIVEILGRRIEAGEWRTHARTRALTMSRLMWDDRDGLYYDYSFQTKQVRHYPFLTTFYPLWAGIASREQAARVVKNLPMFERPGGLQTSTFKSGNQWDAPFGWAPLQMIAVEGLRRYGYNQDADRITSKFLSMVLQDFLKTGIIVEKYDVERRASNVAANIGFGYRSNEPGFGWTNAAFLRLYRELPDAAKRAVLEPVGAAKSAGRR